MPPKPAPFREVRRRLLAAGFVEVGQTGSHVKFAAISTEGTRTAVVPRHREVTSGTIRSILRQAGISIAEWERLE